MEQSLEALKRTALWEVHTQLQAKWVQRSGWHAADHYGSPDEEATETQQGVALADWGWLPKFELRGLTLTEAPAVGGGARCWRLGRSHYLVTCPLEQRDATREQLDSIRSQDVPANEPPRFYITDATSIYGSLLLAGPRSRQVLRKLADLDVTDAYLPPLGCLQTGIHHVQATVMREDVAGLPAYLLVTGREYSQWLWESVMEAGHEFGIVPFGLAAYSQLKQG